MVFRFSTHILLFICLAMFSACQTISQHAAITKNQTDSETRKIASENQNVTIVSVRPALPAISENKAVTQSITPEQQDVPSKAEDKASATTQTALSAPAKPVIQETQIPPAIRSFDPKILAGKTRFDIEALLGPADWVRHEGQISIWQYRQDSCVLDVFFRSSPASTDMQIPAEAYHLRSRVHKSQLDITRCHEEIYQQRM